MKRHKNLYGEVIALENLLQAAKQARRGKRFQPATQIFHHRLETELIRLQKELQAQTYRPGEFRNFIINDPKPRLISAAPYRDRIVHHALCNIIEPIFDRTFIFDSYACRKGKGTHAAVRRFSHFMQSRDYVLKCDIRRYFASVDHGILKQLVRRKIGCAPTLALTDRLIDHCPEHLANAEYFPGDTLFSPSERRCGLPMGNQTSQFFANVYLNPLDHFVQEELGHSAYIRYVDDFVILEEDKEELHQSRQAVEAFLQQRLRLRLHPRKQFVAPVATGIDFLGYRVFPTHRLLRKASGYRFARRLKTMQKQYRAGNLELEKIQQRVTSWIGHARHADTYGLRTALLESAVFSRA